MCADHRRANYFDWFQKQEQIDARAATNGSRPPTCVLKPGPLFLLGPGSMRSTHISANAGDVTRARGATTGKTIHGGYGPRLFNFKGHNQVENALSLLRKKPASRRAVIQLFDAADLDRDRVEIPCTCTLQLMVRHGRLHMLTNMRSNDAFIGLPHDIFAFTMLQEIFARSLGVELGTYKQAVGSLHLYENNAKHARKYIEEGFQSTVSMPPMPAGDPWPQITQALEAEASIRRGKSLDAEKVPIHRYWQDIVRLLQIFALSAEDRAKRIPALKKQMSTRVYDVYIEKRKRAATTTPMSSTPIQEPLL